MKMTKTGSARAHVRDTGSNGPDVLAELFGSDVFAKGRLVQRPVYLVGDAAAGSASRADPTTQKP